MLGIGIAITDHNEIRGALKIDRIPHLLTIPGIESDLQRRKPSSGIFL
jgi:predicted metal-dependent phosphoesterase TrpH